MEDKTTADLSNIVEKTDSLSNSVEKAAQGAVTGRGTRANAVVPRAKPEGSPGGSGRKQGEGDPSAALRSAQDGARPEGAAAGTGNARPRNHEAGCEEGDDPSVACGDSGSAPFAVPETRADDKSSTLVSFAHPRWQSGSSPCTGEPRTSDARPCDAVAVGFAARSARIADEAEALYAQWAVAAKELAKEYPGFDLAAAAKEPAFGRLLRAGVDLRSAYEATHMDSVREAIRASAAAEAEARTLDAVRMRGMRPDENGARGAAAVMTGGMAGLSREQRARIAERAMRGLL